MLSSIQANPVCLRETLVVTSDSVFSTVYGLYKQIEFNTETEDCIHTGSEDFTFRGMAP